MSSSFPTASCDGYKMDSRRLIYAAGYARAMIEARSELQKLAANLQAEVNRLRAELAQVRAQFDELRSISLARQRGELEPAELHRLREFGRAKAATRDPLAPLH